MKIAVCVKQVPTKDWQPRLDDANLEILRGDIRDLEPAGTELLSHPGPECSRALAGSAPATRGPPPERDHRDPYVGSRSRCGHRYRDR